MREQLGYPLYMIVRTFLFWTAVFLILRLLHTAYQRKRLNRTLYYIIVLLIGSIFIFFSFALFLEIDYCYDCGPFEGRFTNEPEWIVALYTFFVEFVVHTNSIRLTYLWLALFLSIPYSSYSVNLDGYRFRWRIVRLRPCCQPHLSYLLVTLH